MHRFSIFGELVAVDGKRDELVNILQEAELLLIKKNVDCHLYSVNVSMDKPNSVFVFEIWTSEVSHQNSLQDEEVLSLIMKAKPIITEMNRHHTLTSVSKRVQNTQT